jgi:Protein of unknown function (DUF732)
VKRLLVTLTLAGLAVASAPMSYANPGDADFVAQLSAAGINITDPAPLVGNTARQICGLLQANWTVGTASYSVKSGYPAVSEAQDRQFVLLAQKNYCPNA